MVDGSSFYGTGSIRSLNGMKNVREQLNKSYTRLPLAFEKNQGQLDNRVKFLSRGAEADIYLTANEIILSLANPKQPDTSPLDSEAVNHQGNDKATIYHKTQRQQAFNRDKVAMRLAGANTARIIGVDESPGTVNYFIGNNSKKWHTDIRTYRKVAYRGVYPGIDQIFYGNEQQLEYDFIVSPGANPGAIKLAFKGASDMAIDLHGDLVLHAKGSQEVRLHKPYVYQEINGGKREIPSRYVMRAKHQVGFEINDYDVSRPLVIDPVLSYSTYLGGSGNDAGFDVAVDASGSVYMTGSTDSSDLSPLGGTNVFVAKLNPAGTERIYLAIIGGSGDDTGFSIAVDNTGSAYVAGSTNSVDFPVMNSPQVAFGGGSQDAFIAKLNPSGSGVVYATYFGGSGNDAAFGLAVDSTGSAYVTGSTDSPELSTLGKTDAFVAKLNPSGSERLYLSTLGGGGDDTGFEIAVDGDGSAYVVGATDSTNFTTVNAMQPNPGGAQDAFVAKLNPAGSALVYSTYLGGTGNDAGFGIAVDTIGNAYITGSTNSPQFSTLGDSDVFVAKLTASGDSRMYFAILGGSGDEVGFSIAVDATGNAYVAGSTDSSNFTAANPLQQSIGGSQDAFVAKLSPAGSTLVSSTYIGGRGNDVCFAVTVNTGGDAYLVGFTDSTDFPAAGSLQSSNAGSGDAFIVKVGVGITPATLQLSQISYSLGEGSGSIPVVVNRIGDTTIAATINYATSDSAGLNNCNIINGIASSRCDYATSIGTLRFAAGETSKTISIPVVDDNFAEGNEIFTLTLSNPTGATLGSNTTATITITDNANTTGNPIDSVLFFVRQHYIDFLGREPDSFGFRGWQDILNNCASGDTRCDRIEVSAGFFRSSEFQERGYFTYRFYTVALGRKPDYVEFMPDLAKVSGFLTEAEKEANKVAFADEFMARTAFKTKYDSTLNNPTAYVDALLSTAGLPNHPSRAGWIAGLTNGQLTRARVLRELAESAEAYDKFYTEAFVVMQYFGYLRRDPDKFYLDWIQIMNQDKSNYRNMVNGFMNSTEYRARFGQ
jgi:hypothetical protein